ncbi:SRPBCC family protein [Cellulomonas soli]
MAQHSTQRDVTGEHLHLVHELDAVPAEVFRHLVDPALLARWFGPHSVRVPVESVVCEPFPGGEWKLVMLDTATGTPYPVSARISEIVPPRLLVFRESETEADDATVHGLRLRVELREHGDGHTVMELHQGPFPPDTTMAGDTAEGWVQAFEKLDALLSGRDAPEPTGS